MNETKKRRGRPPVDDPKVSRSFSIRESAKDELDKLARRRGVSISCLINEALTSYLDIETA